MSQNVENSLVKIISSLGFENVSSRMHNDTLTLAYENNIYRWDARGLNVIIDTISKNVSSQTYLKIITLKNDIPVFETSLRAGDWKAYRNDSVSKDQLKERIGMTNLTHESWKELKGCKRSNPNLYKFDFVIYPQFTFMNITFARIYEIMFNIAPALEFSLWKGNKFTGQVIIPVYYDTIFGSQSIRTGYFTVSQEFRLPGPFFSTVTIGKFNFNRYGLDVLISHPFKNPHWDISLNLGLTGRTYNIESFTYLSRDFTTSWMLKAGYFYSKFNLQIDVSGGKYVYGDYGARVDITRHFGETSIGFYGIYSGGVPNGGFHFAIPLPPGKRSRRHHVRVLPPRYYDLQYNGGTVLLKGHTYSSSPSFNRSEDYFNLLYIKNSLH